MIGALDRRVVFQREVVSVDDYNNQTAGTWTNVMTVWGDYRSERMAERMEAGRMEDAVAGRLKIRYSIAAAAIVASNRAIIDDVPYNILAVDPDRRDGFIYMQVERGVPS